MPIVSGTSDRKRKRKEVCSQATMRAGVIFDRYVCRKNTDIAATKVAYFPRGPARNLGANQSDIGGLQTGDI